MSRAAGKTATPAGSIVGRMAISGDEWREVRVSAAERGERPSQWIGQAIRQRLQKERKR